MRILQLCKKFPYPPKDGEVIAILNLTKGFKKLGHHVDVLAINTHKHYFDITALPDEILELADFYSVKLNTDVNALDAFLNLFSRQSYNLRRFHSHKYEDQLIKLINEHKYDIIQLEGLYLAQYLEAIRSHSDTPVVMRAHNIEFEIWERIARNEKNPLKKGYLQLLAKRMKKFELSHLNDYDAMVPISQKDADQFTALGCKLPMHVSTAGADLTRLKPDKNKELYPSVFFLGGLDWIPNQEGLEWFLDKVWKAIVKSHQQQKLYIAGRSMPAWMNKYASENVVVLGEVEDAIAYMNSHSIMVVPLLSGSGMRIKIIEGMALGKAIISTTVGAEGINYTEGENILIADSVKEFTKKLLRLMEDKDLFEKISRNSITFAKENYDYLSISRSLANFYSGTFHL